MAWNAPLTFCRSLVRILPSPPLAPVVPRLPTPGRISTTLLNLRHDESMANLRERTQRGREWRGEGKGGRRTEPKRSRMGKRFIMEPVVMKVPGMVASERAIKNKLYLPRALSTGYLVNIPR